MINAAQKGHDITLVSAQGSALAGREWHFESGGKIRVLETVNPNWATEWTHYEAYKKVLEEEFSKGDSVVWDNTWSQLVYKSAANFPKMNVVHTHHGNANWRTPPPGVWFPRYMGVSRPHAFELEKTIGSPFRYVWNGINLPARSEMSTRDDGYLLSLNRISRFKGIHIAMDICTENRIPLVLVGDDTKVEDQSYVFRCIERARRSGGLIKYYGLVDNFTKIELLKGCKGMLACPVERGPNNEFYIEAFGLNAVEANAYGKPALCLANGGHKDVVQHGYNGYLGDDPRQLAFYFDKINDIKPENCRQRVEENFTTDKMTDSYLSIFEKVISGDDSFKW